MLEIDVKELEEVAKIARPLDVALAKTNATNNEDLTSTPGDSLDQSPYVVYFTSFGSRKNYL
jgi:hypothetical protein